MRFHPITGIFKNSLCKSRDKTNHEIILKNYFPICYISSDSLLLFKRNTFYFLDIQSSNIRRLSQIRFQYKRKLFYIFPLLPRLLRMGIRCAIKVSDDIVLFVIGNIIYELNLPDGSISIGYSTNDQCRPLALSQINGISGFEDGIYFGGYRSNPTKTPISIYKRISTDKWEKVFQFPNGAVEHIHNIVADKYNDTVFVLTGDFDHSAGIWVAKNNFSTVEPVLLGEQKFRACIAFPTSNGLIYATDSPFTENSIRLLNKDKNNKWISTEIQPINGSSIYGCEWKDDFVFSTSVEGDGRNQSLFYKLSGRKLGIGIKSNYSIIYKGNLEEGFRGIYKIKKDILPFFLFQFGVLIFPSGKNESEYLPVYHIATKKHSMNTLLLSE